MGKFLIYKGVFAVANYVIGNDKIFGLTNQGQYSVRFDMTDANGTSAFAEYNVCWIENEENKYKLHISKYSGYA
ncbi:hypothetical protein AVEN_82219-1, partial [Araneus ventricosus]